MINEWRLSPIACKEEIIVCTKYTSLCNCLLHESRRCISTNIVEKEVTIIYRRIESLVHAIDSLWSMFVTELVKRTTKLMVTIVTTRIENIITRMVCHHLIRSIDTRTESGTPHGLNKEILVCRGKRLFTVSISLIEIIKTDNTLLLNVEFILA